MKTYKFLDLKDVNAPFMEQLTEAATRVVTGGCYVGGAEVAAFEAELADATGTDCAVGCSNGLDALRLIFRAYIELGEMAPGDEVIVPANTYIASVLAVTDCGLVPVPVEPDPATFNLDPTLVEAAITRRTRAIMPVHLYGRACWHPVLQALSVAKGLKIVEDNAQAIGACVAGIRTGALGDAAAFSFYPTKNVGALGDAGAVTTSDRRLADAVRALANYGCDRRYHNVYAGLNCRLDPVQAAMLRVKLPHTDAENAVHRALAHTYLARMSHPDIILPQEPTDHAEHVWHQFVLRVPQGRRDEFRQHMLSHGVHTDVYYPTPPHRQPCYAATPLAALELPLTEQLAAEVVSLPVNRGTSEADAAEISAIANAFPRTKR